MSDQSASGPHLWSRQGFTGRVFVTKRQSDLVNYRSVKGPHAPTRLNIHDLDLPDRNDPEALPLSFMLGHDGSRILVSGLADTMPFAFRNVDADELHFVSQGRLRYRTDCGVIDVEPGDFLSIPKAFTYQVEPLEGPTLRVILERKQEIKLVAPPGMVMPKDVRRPDMNADASSFPFTNRLTLSSFDGVTEFETVIDPLSNIGDVLDGEPPVWALNLRKISRLTYYPGGGPPAPFAGCDDNSMLLFTLSSRPTTRQPMHYNADYDELTYYFAGPDPRGGMDAEGTLVWIPKGVAHHGPSEDVSTGEFWVWLLETTSTYRLDPAALAVAKPLDTEGYGVHPSAL